MSNLIRRKSGILVPNETAPCGFCPSIIIKEKEIEQRFHIHKSKPMCGVCRAVKLSKFRRIIQSDTEKNGKADMQNAIDTAKKQEQDNVLDIAAQSPSTIKKL